MNVDTTKTAAIFTSNEMSGIASSNQLKRFSGNSTSFKDEMKSPKSEEIENKEETKEINSTEKTSETEKTDKKETEKTENKSTEKTENKSSEKTQTSDKTQTLEGEISTTDQENHQNQGQNQQGENSYFALSDQVQAFISANGGNFNFSSINVMEATTKNQISNMKASVDYTSIQMSDTDAKFFADLVSKTDMSMGSIAGEFEKALQQGNIKTVQSTAKASAALIEALKESSKTNQPFRIDFDKDVSVILQVDKAGKINANFIPGDKAAENYLRNNIEFLRQRFDEENISYGELNYSQSRRNKEEQQKRNNKERGNE